MRGTAWQSYDTSEMHLAYPIGAIVIVYSFVQSDEFNSSTLVYVTYHAKSDAQI